MAGLFEAGYYSIRDRKWWLIWIGIFAGFWWISKKPFIIPPTTSMQRIIKSPNLQAFGDPFHANLIRID